jgi:hypothetical protein
VAVNSFIEVGPLVLMFVITENIMKRPVFAKTHLYLENIITTRNQISRNYLSVSHPVMNIYVKWSLMDSSHSKYLFILCLVCVLLVLACMLAQIWICH